MEARSAFRRMPASPTWQMAGLSSRAGWSRPPGWQAQAGSHGRFRSTVDLVNALERRKRLQGRADRPVSQERRSGQSVHRLGVDANNLTGAKAGPVGKLPLTLRESRQAGTGSG